MMSSVRNELPILSEVRAEYHGFAGSQAGVGRAARCKLQLSCRRYATASGDVSSCGPHDWVALRGVKEDGELF